MDHQQLKHLIDKGVGNNGQITALTGAGISAESGIPTFRGPEGYWTVGSQVYQPQQMATFRMFKQNPKAVWQWYLYRWEICRQAAPNTGHHALVGLEGLLPGRFTLVTQNVDNLHRRAGQGQDSIYEIHGNIFFVRCSGECQHAVLPFPSEISGKAKDEPITDAEWQALHCQNCGQLLRPHVLWFDEIYDEHYYRLESTLATARQTDLLIVVGTAGATNLPNQIVQEVYHRGGAIIDINIEPNPFSRLAEQYNYGISIQEPSSMALPRLLDRMRSLL